MAELRSDIEGEALVRWKEYSQSVRLKIDTLGM